MADSSGETKDAESDINEDLYKGYEHDPDRIERLFKDLDRNNDGKIDADELAAGLKRLRVRHSKGQLEKIMSLGDQSKDGCLSFDEFLKYMSDHERKLWLVFKSIDTDDNGEISITELKKAFKKMNVNVTESEIHYLLKCMDTDGSLKIDWNEWREYHLLNPSGHSMHDIMQFWRHSSYIDIGEDFAVPDEFTVEEKITGMWWRQLVAGGGAGVVSRTFTAPLDRLKVLLQVKATGRNNLGVLSGMRKLVEEGGVRSLWRGNGANVIKIAPESAVKFFAYEKAKKLFMTHDGQIEPWQRLIAGSLAGIASQSSIYPMEVLKTRLALARTGQYSGLVHATKVILEREGLRSFYRGLVPSLIGIIPYAGIDLAVYETVKQSWLNYHKNESADPGVLVLLACGTISSTCGQLASYPLALIRTKLQAQTGVGRHETVRELVSNIWQADGIRGLYRGIIPNFMKVIPAVSISYVVYEKLRTSLGVAPS
ncbi:calcium-binding mitochondrial carrier protein SCaMC-2-like [Dendronephthya gigantea]|uniref:calcium-binding mitochondrial carrier protein SCaMC-2-like n=1 Tax=Dendronephthya gigantea TaxID=151771 RepID=UPI00106A8BFD|nr:calcium-binding mitochondrial carrier protein SCaMC-2-like [Dendronephthya gigantea]